jgi:hypothetical protein
MLEGASKMIAKRLKDMKTNNPATAESVHLCVADTSRYAFFQQLEMPWFSPDKLLFLLKK